MYSTALPDFHLLKSQAHILIEIEDFVMAVAASDEAAFETTMSLAGDVIVQELPLGCYLRHMPRFISAYCPGYWYSEHVEAFFDQCDRNGFLDLYPAALAADIESHPLDWQESFQELVEELRAITRQDAFRRRVHDRRYETKQKCAVLEAYTQSLQAYYARLQVIRVDLHYRKDCQAAITIDDVYRHFDAFRRLKHHNPLFRHLVGDSWCIEQGRERGYHLHLVYFFLGSEVRSDWYKAQSIGEAWRTVTEEMGTFHSCNADKSRYPRLGIGLIHRNNPIARQNTVEAVTYLARVEKDDQYLRMRPPGRRTFGTGQAPDLSQKRGRPPQDSFASSQP